MTSFASAQKAFLKDLETDKYQGLGGIFLDRVGVFIQRLFKWPKPASDLFNYLVLSLTVILVGFAVSLIRGEIYPELQRLIPLYISVVFVAFALLPVAKKTSEDFLDFLAPKIVISINNINDLSDFRKYLNETLEIKRAVSLCLIITILLDTFTPLYGIAATDTQLGVGPNIISLLVNFPASIGVYYLIVALSIPIRLSNYSFSLYPANPGRSDLVRSISNLFNNYVLVSAIFITLLTVISVSPGTLTLGGMLSGLFGAWLPMLGLFFVTHISLMRIIKRHKRMSLNMIEIQAIGLSKRRDKRNLTHMGKLQELHEALLKSPNSMFNTESLLRLTQSLLLPLLGIILSNLK